MRRWLIYTGAALALLAAAPPARPDVPVRVIDGDTIAAQGVTIRVIGLDAPEMRGQCPAEMRLARIAKARMQQLLAGGASAAAATATAARSPSCGTAAGATSPR
jgi:endonuclease YncB( thermonuclease family)